MSDYLARLVAKSRESPGAVRPRLGSLFEPPSIDTPESGTALSGRPVAPSFDAERATSTPASDQQVDTQSTDITAAGASKIIPTPLPGEAGHLRAESTRSPKDVQGPFAGAPRTAFERQFEETQPTQPTATIVPRTDKYSSDRSLEAISPVTKDDPAGSKIEQTGRSAGNARRRAGADSVTDDPPRAVRRGDQTQTSNGVESESARTVRPGDRTQISDGVESESARPAALKQPVLFAGLPEAEPSIPAVEPRPETQLAGQPPSSRSVHTEVMPAPPVPEPPPRSRRRSVEPPAIHVTIGRIDVRAVMPPSRPAPKARRVRPKPVLSLEAYLQQRNGGQR